MYRGDKARKMSLVAFVVSNLLLEFPFASSLRRYAGRFFE